MPKFVRFSIAKLASCFVAGLGLLGSAPAQTTAYRQAYPLGDATSLEGLSVNLNTHAPTDAQLQQIADAGFRYVRIDFPWQGVERTKGTYTWTDLDAIMARTLARGLRVIALVGYSNTFYTATGAPNTPESRAGYAAFARACAARYAHRGVVWEIYNEPNLAGWWPNPNPVDYAALANAAVAAIRGASSDEWVIGLTTQTPAGWNNPYIQTVLDSGVLASGGFDAIGYHPYTQANPETMNKEWDTARTMIAYSQPAGRSVGLLAGEVGYSRMWSGITPAVQATYLMRLVLNNLAQGLPLTNLFSFEDGANSTVWQDNAGLTARTTNAAYPAFSAVKRLTSSLKGYKYAKRLTLANPNDYCLLFNNATNPNDCRVVVWTTDPSHTVALPSSAVPFTSLVLSNGATGSATVANGLLTLPINGEATIFSGTGANPTLGLTSAWTKLPANLTLSTRSDAIAQLGSVIVSPAWANAPAGSTLKIEDVPTPVPGFNRASYTATLGNLSTLTLGSSAAQTVFNSLGALQDTMNAPRTLKLTLVLPDGNTVVQQAAVTRQQPLSLFATMPSGWALTLRAENPTGAPFSGTIKAAAGGLNVSVPLTFARGETSKQINFPTLTSTLLATGVEYDLFDASGNVLDPAAPTIDGAPQIVFRAPNVAAGAGYSLSMKGSATVSGTATLSYGTASWSFLTGSAQADLTYTFGVGGPKYMMLNGPAALTNQAFAKVPASIGMWVNGDGNGGVLRTQFIDSNNQVFQCTYGAVDWTGWKWVSIPIAGNLAVHWGGANDGVARGSVRCLVPLTIDSNLLGTSGKLSITGITIVGQK